MRNAPRTMVEWKWWVEDIVRDIRIGGFSYAFFQMIPYKYTHYWYSFKMLFRKKYNKVYLTRIKWNEYSDVTERLVHANFELLCHFVEKEKPFEKINWDSDGEHKFARDEINALYEWWKGYPYDWEKSQEYLEWKDFDQNRSWDIVTKPHTIRKDGKILSYILQPSSDKETLTRYVKAMTDYENKQNKVIEQNLCRLIKIRNYLWT